MSSVRLTQRKSIENGSHAYHTDVPDVASSHSMHIMNEVQPSGLDISKDISLSIKPKANMRTYLENMDFPEMVRLINWFLVFSSVIIFNIPLFMNADAQAHGHPTGDYAYLAALRPNATTFDNALIKKLEKQYVGDDGIWLIDSLQYNVMSAINLGIAIPSSMDLLVDVFNEIFFPPVAEDKSKHVVRMSHLERFVFLCGVICNGFYLFFPWTTMNIMAANNVNNVFNNLCVILQISPVLMFLERSTSSFPPLWTLGLNLCLCTGVDLYAISLLYPVSWFINTAYNPIFVLYSLATWGVVLSCLRCFFMYLRDKGFVLLPGDEPNPDIQFMDAYDDFNTYQVPALHMIGLMVEMLVCFVWYYLLSNMSNSVNVLLNVLFILSASLVMVIEMRVRANEVQQGLVSCRLFVRKVDNNLKQITNK